jgi:transposase InsO family protein
MPDKQQRTRRQFTLDFKRDTIQRCAAWACRSPTSMSRTGSCLNSAVAESWFGSLKVELVDQTHYRTRAQAHTALFCWVAWYNRFRLHSANGYVPPIEWEQHATSGPVPSTTAA